MATRIVSSLAICVVLGCGTEAHAQGCSERVANASYGIGIDINGKVWVPEHVSGLLRKYNSNGTLDPASPFDMQIGYNRGVAVTPSDNHIRVAHTGWNNSDNRVTRYNDTGTLCEEIVLNGFGPSALAVDTGEHVWVTCMKEGDNEVNLPAVERITPAPASSLPPPCGPPGGTAQSLVEQFDIDHLDSGEDHPLGYARPYNYSDMTGLVTLQTSATGTVASPCVFSDCVWALNWGSSQPTTLTSQEIGFDPPNPPANQWDYTLLSPTSFQIWDIQPQP